MPSSPRKAEQTTVARLQSERDRALNELKKTKGKRDKGSRDNDRRSDTVDLKPNEDWNKDKKQRRGGRSH